MKTYLIIFDNGRLYKMEAKDFKTVQENLVNLCLDKNVITIINISKTKDMIENILNSATEINVNKADYLGI